MKNNYLSKLLVASTFILLLSFGCNKEGGKLTVTTKPVSEITKDGAKCGGVVASSGIFFVGNCGICWNTEPSPTTNNYFTTDHQGNGEYTSVMRHLSPGTKYYVRAYATTNSGIMYGEEKVFTTEEQSVATVSVFTNDVTEITASTAKCGGVITSNTEVTITARGVCWSTSTEPSLTYHTSDGQGLGFFSSNVTGLNQSTTYNIWAYATTSDGITIYGDLKTFTTGAPGSLPVVTIDEITDITGTSAKCGGTVTSDGGVNVTDRGICWSTTQNPTVNHSHLSIGNGTGHFTAEMDALENGTTYYVRAYATNSEGTNYSSVERTFTTLSAPTVITISPVSSVTQTTAIASGNVTADGGETPVRGICWSQAPNPTTNNNPVYSGSGLGEYTAQITGLLPNTTYHVRAFAKNSVSTSYGQDVTFTTAASSQTETWLYYDDGTIESTWGYNNGGTLEWAVMFPSNMMEQYIGMNITKVKIYVGETGTYYTRFYTGGSTPETQIFSGYCDLDNNGWWTINLHEPVSITAQNLWVSTSVTHEAGEHPAGSSAGSNNPNARWINWGSHGWCDAYTAGWANQDITWAVRVFVTNGNKSSEFELPQATVPSYKCEPTKAKTSQGIGNCKINKRK